MKKEVAILFNAISILVAIGVLMVYSASLGQDNNAYADSFEFAPLLRQLKYVALGLLGMSLTFFIDYHRFLKGRWILAAMIATAAALVFVLKFGVELNGARRWLMIAGNSVQPSEFAKITVLLFLASYLARIGGRAQRLFEGFCAPLCVVGFFAGMVYLEKDLGTPAVMCIASMAVLFLAGARLWHLGAATVGGSTLAVLGIMHEPHRWERIIAFLNPWAHRSGEAFQLIESLAGFARGGLWGLGSGAGEQKLHYLPEAHSDFIFAVLGEEMGLVGCLSVMFLFLVVVIMAFRIAQCAPDRAGYLLASGIGALVGIEALLNIGVVTGMLPTKGLALPFISSGGTSLIAHLVLMGFLLNVGIQAQEEPAPRATNMVRRASSGAA